MKIFLLFFLIVSSLSAAASSDSGRAFLLYLENDSRRIGGPGSDSAYTNGFKFTSIYSENKIPIWARPFLDLSVDLKKELQKSETNFGLSVGHQIYTPRNTRENQLIRNDRPYAAWLYLGFAAYFSNETHAHSVELDVGIVGPEAMGEKIQNGFHQIIGTYDAEGWDNELQTEPTLQLSYQQRLKFLELKRSADKTYFDILPYYGGAFGNVRIDAHVGGLVRFGTHIPDDFGPTRPSAGDGNSYINPSRFKTLKRLDEKMGLYGFAGGRGVLVARDIFLDGNTFRRSHKVNKYPVVTETELGLGVNYSRFSGVWRFVVRSPEFEQRSRFNSFASITLSYLME